VTSYRVNESEPIIVKEPEFLRQVSHIVLQMMSTTDGRRYVTVGAAGLLCTVRENRSSQYTDNLSAKATKSQMYTN